jgi:hypothetical protein
MTCWPRPSTHRPSVRDEGLQPLQPGRRRRAGLVLRGPSLQTAASYQSGDHHVESRLARVTPGVANVDVLEVMSRAQAEAPAARSASASSGYAAPMKDRSIGRVPRGQHAGCAGSNATSEASAGTTCCNNDTSGTRSSSCIERELEWIGGR